MTITGAFLPPLGASMYVCLGAIRQGNWSFSSVLALFLIRL
jgi:hypothetical protein